MTLSATFLPSADVALAIDDGATFVNTGQVHTWTLTLANQGVNALVGVAVQSGASGGLDAVHWTCSASAGSSCAAGGSGDIVDAANLATGGIATYEVTGYVRADAPANVAVSGTASVPAGHVDLTPANDSANDIDAVHFDLIFRNGFDA